MTAISYDGRQLAVADLRNRLLILDDGGRILRTITLEQSAESIGLAALGRQAVAALKDGPLVCYEVQLEGTIDQQ